MGTQLPPRGAQPPQFSPHVCYGQTVWHLVRIGLGHILWGPAPLPCLQKKAQPRLFGPYLLHVSKRLDGSRCHSVQTTLCYISISPKRGSAAPSFRPMSIVAKRLVVLGPSDIVLEEVQLCPRKGNRHRQFSAHVCWGIVGSTNVV